MRFKRYNSVAISLHWLIAILLAGLVILARIMNSYDSDDPFRFELIQWHKSFGIMALLLVVFRLLWRIAHKPPRLPSRLSQLEKFGAGAAHVALYCLMFIIPLSGWIMVSASPLNLQTRLFGIIPWPHLPFVSELPEKAELAERFVQYHHWSAQALIVIVVVHIAAALRHQLFLKDNVMSRMIIGAEHKRDNRQGIIAGILLAFAGSLFLTSQVQLNLASRVTGDQVLQARGMQTDSDALNSSLVGFTALQLGEEVVGIFDANEVSLVLDDHGGGSLEARVDTSSINTGDGQIDATVVTDEWFASTEFPVATFVSSKVQQVAEGDYEVEGLLTIKSVGKNISFPMIMSNGLAKGEFTINRTDYKIGNDGQDEFVDPVVTIRFEISTEGNEQ